MKRLSSIAIFGMVLVYMLGLSAPALADPFIEVVPLDHDFGDVQVGNSSTTMITISNFNGHDLEIISVSLSGSADFSISMAPDPVVGSGMSTLVEITFAPSTSGYVSASLNIESNDSNTPVVTVSLAGMGVGQEQPPVSVSDILAFFDASVADGTLYGNGPGNSADGRRNALRNMIEAAGDLIDDGYIDITLFEIPGWKYWLFFPSIYFGTFQKTQKHFKVKRLVLSGIDLPVQYNGELLGIKDRVEMRILPCALKIVSPAKMLSTGCN